MNQILKLKHPIYVESQEKFKNHLRTHLIKKYASRIIPSHRYRRKESNF